MTSGTLFARNISGSATGTGPVSVIGGTFGGTGSLSGAITVNGTATLEAGIGASTGTLTASGGVTFTGGTFKVALDSDTPSTDTLSAPSVTLGAGLALLNVSDLGTTALSNTAAPFVIIATTSGVSGNFSGLVEGSTVTVGNNNYTISYGNTLADDVTLSPAGTPVPEPASIALFSIGGIGLLRRRRRA